MCDDNETNEYNNKNDKSKKGDEDMAKILDYPKTDNTNKKTGWRRMAQIAEQSMKDNDYNIKDVKKELKNIRDKY